MVFQALNRLKWNGGLGDCEVLIIHRGAPGNTRTIRGTDIKDVRRTYITYSSHGRETTIPLHRVSEVRRGGTTIWKRSTRRGCSRPTGTAARTGPSRDGRRYRTGRRCSETTS